MLWGSGDGDPGGGLVECFIAESDMCLRNDESRTCLDSGRDAFSTIDLSVCHPSVFIDSDWSVCGDQHGNDHFPIIIESMERSSEYHDPKWKLGRAGWSLFHSLFEVPWLNLPPLLLMSAVDVFLGPGRVLGKVTHGTMKIVRKLLRKGGSRCLCSASAQQRKV